MGIGRLSLIIAKYYRPLRLTFLWSADGFILFISIVVAIFLYTRVVSLPYTWTDIFSVFGIILAGHIVAFSLLGIYNVSFQYANILLTAKLVVVQAIYLVIIFFLLNGLFPGLWPPLVAVLQGLLAISGAAALRISGLIFREVAESRGKSYKQVLIYGAGETGKNIALALRSHHSPGMGRIKILGFLDDDPILEGKIIYGYKVLGDLGKLQRLMLKQEVNELIVAIPSLSGDRIRALRERCRSLNILVKMIPSFYEVYNKSPEDILSSLRQVEFEDLLRRPKRTLPLEALQSHFEDKTVFVLGGAGSIGSELVSQLLRLFCQKLIVVDSNELNLYQLGERFRGYGSRLEFILLDAKDRNNLAAAYATYSPHIVFHAAAYKHVPVVESNPVTAVLNNISGLKNSADLAHDSGCEQFIFVSTDKAVRPANVMGATKRIGELYVQSLNARSASSMFGVRFGNVIGSSGSLVPSVVASIERGETVKITHPAMTRYFMLLPEAVSLILNACLHAKGGEIYVLDMGEPVKIVDLVQDLILLLDKQPGSDVSMEFVGTRPGEKIHEELFDPDIERIQHMDGYFVSTSQTLSFDEISGMVDDILHAAQENQKESLLALLDRAVALPSKSGVKA